jgi:DoxX-like family
VEAFETYGYPQWFRIFTAFVEAVTALLLIIRIWNQQSATIGGLLVFATMIGAISTHIKLNDSFKNMVLPIVLLVLGLHLLSNRLYKDIIFLTARESEGRVSGSLGVKVVLQKIRREMIMRRAKLLWTCKQGCRIKESCCGIVYV